MFPTTAYLKEIMMGIIRTLIVVCLLALPGVATAQSELEATGLVNDFVGVMSADEAHALNEKLLALEGRTGVEFAIAIVESLHGKTEKDFATELGNHWGVGKADKDNGILFLHAPNERKVFIAVGDGIIGTVTNARVQRALDTKVFPALKRGDFVGGYNAGVDAIIATIEQGSSSESKTSSRTEAKVFAFIMIMMFVGILGFMYIGSAMSNRRYHREAVLQMMEEVPSLITAGRANADHEDVTAEHLGTFHKAMEGFDELLTLDPKKTNWQAMDERFRPLVRALKEAVKQLQKDIDFAAEAREQGPELFAQFPQLIADAEKALAEGKDSKKARERLESARSAYQRAQQEMSSMSILNWIIIYQLLFSGKNDIAYAQQAHHNLNHPTSSSYRSSSSGTGYGSMGGFGGGGFSGGGAGGSY